MTHKTKFIRPMTIAAAVLGLLAMSGPSHAAPAVAAGNLKVRTGPGTSYAAVGALRRGDVVDVRRCKRDWCNVRYRGIDGWVARSYLAEPVQRYSTPAPVIPFSLHFGFGGTSKKHHHHKGKPQQPPLEML